MSTEWVPLSMSTPPPAIALRAFQRSFIGTRPVEGVLEEQGRPDGPGLDQAPRLHHVVHVAELRGHHELEPARAGEI